MFKESRIANALGWVRGVFSKTTEKAGSVIGSVTWPQILPKPEEKQYRIIHNRVVCKKCHEIIESIHRHDFVWCACVDEEGQPNGIAVDGGTDYLRRIGDLDGYIEISAHEEVKNGGS